jgi:DNA polymerase-3 subunit alpha
MQSGMVDDFIDRKHGRQAVSYPHALLQPVLEPTYGTIVYQEQVMQSAQVLGGFTLGGADILRRAMGKKKFEVMQEERAKFVTGALELHKIPEEESSAIFDLIEKFAGYGFNKSHSAAYALITYQTGYLKTFYPVEFMAALLTTEMSSSDNVVKYIHEARTHGIEVLPPDINISERRFTVDYNVDEATRRRRRDRNTAYGRVRFGLGAIKGLGDATIEAIQETRERIGGFTDIYHLCEEMPDGKVNKKVLEVLAKAGALDGFGQSRAVQFATIERALEAVAQLKKDRASGQTNMFDMFASAGASVDKTYLDVPEWPEKERLQFEREAVGFYLSGHPLDRYVEDAKKLGAIPSVDLLNQRHNSEAQIVGIVAGLRERLLKSGDGRWAVVTLEDTFGQAEVLVFSRVFGESEMALKSGEPLMIKGRVLIDDIDDDGQQLMPKMRAAEVGLLAEEQIKRTRWLEVVLDVPAEDDDISAPTDERFDPTREDSAVRDRADEARATGALAQIREIVGQYPGETPTRIQLTMPAGYRVTLGVAEDLKVHPDDNLMMALERVRGVAQVTRV